MVRIGEGGRSLGFALLGCGRIAERHVSLLSGGHVAGAHLVAVCDVQQERRDRFSKEHGVPGYASLAEMMAAKGSEIDVVNILTDSGEHAVNTVEVAGYGKHVVVEKPMALTLEDADDMIAACDRAGVKLFVVKQNRYNPPVMHLREALDAGRFGKIVMGTVRVRWCRPQSYYDQDSWRGTWAKDGGVFANQASHHVDLLRWLLGEPETVYAVGRTALVNIETEDTGVAVIKFRSGAIGVVEATTATRPKDLEGSLSLLGETGSVEIAGFAVNQMKTWAFSTPLPGDDDIREGSSQAVPNVYGFGHRAFLAHVVETIKGERLALVDGLEGRKTLELLAAIYESIATGKEIPLRFRARHSHLGQAVRHGR